MAMEQSCISLQRFGVNHMKFDAVLGEPRSLINSTSVDAGAGKSFFVFDLVVNNLFVLTNGGGLSKKISPVCFLQFIGILFMKAFHFRLLDSIRSTKNYR